MPDLEEIRLRNEERYADVWGLSSLLMSGFLVIPAPILIFMTSYLWVNFPRAVPAPFARELFYVAVVSMVAVVLVSFLALVVGLKAWRAAAYTGQPAGFAVAGTLMSVVATGIWIFVAVDLLMILGTYAYPSRPLPTPGI
jgi:hypothetical protein